MGLRFRVVLGIFGIFCGFLAIRHADADAGVKTTVVAAEFRATADSLITRMHKVGLHRFSFDLDELEYAIETTAIVPTTTKSLEIVSFPDQRNILVSVARWMELHGDAAQIERVVLHHYLRIIGAELNDEWLTFRVLDEIKPESLVNLSIGQFNAKAFSGNPLSEKDQCILRCEKVQTEELEWLFKTSDTSVLARAQDCFSRCSVNGSWNPRAVLAPLPAATKALHYISDADCATVAQSSLNGLELKKSYGTGSTGFQQVQNYVLRGLCNGGDKQWPYKKYTATVPQTETLTLEPALSSAPFFNHELSTHSVGRLFHHGGSSKKSTLADLVTNSFVKVIHKNEVALYWKTETIDTVKSKTIAGVEQFKRRRFVFNGESGNLEIIEDALYSSADQSFTLTIYSRRSDIGNKNMSELKAQIFKDLIAITW